MQTTIRIHTVTSTATAPNWGTTSCDFRDGAFIGDKEGDHHSTREELDLDDSSPLVAEVLAVGPQLNTFLANFWAEKTKGIDPSTAAMIPHLRIGVWDKVAPR